MGKEGKKQPKKVFQLLTTAQSNAYKEQVKKESEVLEGGAEERLQELESQVPNPNYMSIYAKNRAGVNTVHPLDEPQHGEYQYDPKAKRDRHFHLKQEPDKHDAYKFPMTSNQQYGWRQPYDNLAPSFAMKNTFDEKLLQHMASQKSPPQK